MSVETIRIALEENLSELIANRRVGGTDIIIPVANSLIYLD